MAFDEFRAAASATDSHAEKTRLSQLFDTEELPFSELCTQVDAIVAAGPAVVRLVHERCRRPTLIVFTPRYLADEIIETSNPTQLTAIYLEADPVLNLELISTVLAPATTVGVLVSERTQGWLTRLGPAAERLGLTLEPIVANDDEDIVRLLHQRIDQLDAVLLIPDDHIINGWSLKPIFLMTARRFIPVFGGATDHYVKAGAAMAVVADGDGQVAQIKSFIQRLARGERPAPSYPAATRIAVNQVVAQALSIKSRKPHQRPWTINSSLASTDRSC